MNNKHFNLLWSEALRSDDALVFLNEWLASSIWGDTEKLSDSEMLSIRETLMEIWNAAHMSIKDICEQKKLTMAELSNRFCIPYRTIQNWCNGTNKCPDYVRLMILKQLNIL